MSRASMLLDNGDERLSRALTAVLALKVVRGDELRFSRISWPAPVVWAGG